jgi:hypothetical protein
MAFFRNWKNFQRVILNHKAGNITICLKINKRQEWENHLLKQSQLTSSGQYSERRVKNGEKMPIKLSQLDYVHLLEVDVPEIFLILKKIPWTPNYQDCIYALA